MLLALTTHDNPYDPFDEPGQWLTYDSVHGYNSFNILRAYFYDSDSFTDYEYDLELERAIDQVIVHDPLNIYKKYKKEEDGS